MDIRYVIRDKVNEIRRRNGKNELSLHEDESANCKAHAQFLADSHERGSKRELRHAEDRLLRHWKENLLYYEGWKNPEEAVAHLLNDLEQNQDAHYKKMLEAKEFVAADIVVRKGLFKNKVFLVQRFK